MKKSLKFFVLFLLVLLTAYGLIGCGSSADYSSDSVKSEEAVMTEEWGLSDAAYVQNSFEEAPEAAAPAEDVNTAAGTDVPELMENNNSGDRKLIKTVDLQCETMEFDKFLSDIEARTNALGGYVESSNFYGNEGYRSGNMTCRIPSDKSTEMEGFVGENSNVLGRSVYTEDVTLQYSDLDAHIRALRTEQTTLEGMIKEAKDIDTLLAIQTELANIRYQIESYESSMRGLKNRIQFDTFNIYISEVKTESATEDKSFGSKVGAEFKRSTRSLVRWFENAGIWLFGNIISIIFVLAVIAAVVLLIRFLICKIRKTGKCTKKEKKNKNKNKKAEGSSKNENTEEPLDSANPK